MKTLSIHPMMSEAGLLSAIIDVAPIYGWLRIHFRPARMKSGGYATPIQGDPGFYDLVLVKAPVFLVAELKGYDKNGRLGQLNAEQWEWLCQAQLCGIPAFLWTPDDWISGEILEVLTR